MNDRHTIRLGADIGGTFTDIVLDVAGVLHTTKVLTTHDAPEQAILDGTATVCAMAGIEPGAIGLVIHGTTLATNALIERRGARTAFLTTQGFRDTIEMRTENRFAQYDLDIVLPEPLVPREDRFGVGGRIDAKGRELAPLDEGRVRELAGTILDGGYEAVAIGFLHSYLAPGHEERARAILAETLDLPISVSSEVSPQMREFERFNTVCANAYVRPLMEGYLARLRGRLAAMGADCPVFLIHSGGGLISVETACAFPVRLVESGPAGGAIFAADIAARFGLDRVLSYDMGGTTAKICLIDDARPQTARTFEVARTARFAKGSGMPVSIPVIEMIEIGAGGGSLAGVDAMGRITTGPESAGSEPGPACYARGGTRPAITDADLLLGKLDAARFAGGRIRLDAAAARAAIDAHVGAPLGLATSDAAFGIVEVVDETMANAARVHGVENGKDIGETTMIAFGGAAPLHAARLCEKLGIDRCLVPRGAGVGSAIGFLRAPFGYEALASRVMRLADFDAPAINALLDGLKETAEGFVRAGARGAIVREATAYMRYAGQGWEIPVSLPDRAFGPDDAGTIETAFREHYARHFGRPVEGPPIEFVTFAVRASDVRPAPARVALAAAGEAAVPEAMRAVFDPGTGTARDSAVHARDALVPGARVRGPAVIVEEETTTVLTAPFDAVVQGDGSLLLVRREATR